MKIRHMFQTIIIILIFLATIVSFFHIFSTCSEDIYTIRYNKSYNEYLAKWAYGQSFLNGSERQEYYHELGFFGSTLEEFINFAEYKATTDASNHQIAINFFLILVLALILILEFCFSVLGWVAIEDRIENKC